MRIVLLMAIMLYSIPMNGQELDCSGMKNGVFYAEITEPFKAKWKIARTENQQIEEIIEVPQEIKDMGYKTAPQYELIEWIDDCSYKLRYDESKFDLTPSQKAINDNGGVLATITAIEGNCYYYISTMTINGVEQKLDGKLCAE